jgi:hypothetical protein
MYRILLLLFLISGSIWLLAEIWLVALADLGSEHVSIASNGTSETLIVLRTVTYPIWQLSVGGLIALAVADLHRRFTGVGVFGRRYRPE